MSLHRGCITFVLKCWTKSTLFGEMSYNCEFNLSCQKYFAKRTGSLLREEIRKTQRQQNLVNRKFGMQAYPSIDWFTVLRWPQIGPCNLIYNARAISIELGTILCLLTASFTLITWLVFRLGGMRTSKIQKRGPINFARCWRYVVMGGLRTIVT
jgi:hypothetical protein